MIESGNAMATALRKSVIRFARDRQLSCGPDATSVMLRLSGDLLGS
jgi:hypothetical protein